MATARNAYRLPAARGTGVGSQYGVADSIRGSTVSSGGDAPVAPMPRASNHAHRETAGSAWSEERLTAGDRMTAMTYADRLTTGDRMTAADRLPAPSAARRAGGCVTRVSDADVAPHLDPAHGPEALSWRTRGLPPPGGDDVGDDWEEQQRRWAGGRAPIAAQPQVAHVRGGTVRGGTMRGEALAEDFAEIQEDDRGVQGDRYGYSGASNTAACSTRHGQLGYAAPGSRDSSSSLRVSSSGVQGGRRKPGQGPPSMPLSLSQVMKLAPPEALRGSADEQAAFGPSQRGHVHDGLAGKRFIDPAQRLAAVAEAPGSNASIGRGWGGGRGSASSVGSIASSHKHDPGPSSAPGKGSAVRRAVEMPNETDTVIDWDRFPELSSNWNEQCEPLEQLLQRLEANPEAGLNQATLERRKKAAGPNKIFVNSDGFAKFPPLKLIPGDAVALRDGRLKQVLAVDLVPGDIVHIAAGHRIPADCRLLEASPDLRVEMATIGYRRSDGSGKGHARDSIEVAETVGPWEARNLVFMGCQCEQGSGSAVVIKTGMHCAMGVIAREMGWAEMPSKAPVWHKLGDAVDQIEMQAEVAARSLRLTTADGRCICALM